MVLAAAPLSAPSLGRRLEAAPVIVTSAMAVAPAVAWAGSQPSGPRSPWSPVRQTPKSVASPVVDLPEMEGGQSVIGLLTSCMGGRHSMPRTLQVDLLTLKVVSKSRVMWATSVLMLVFLGLSVLDLGPMYATDRQMSDVHHHLMAPTLGVGYNN